MASALDEEDLAAPLPTPEQEHSRRRRPSHSHPVMSHGSRRPQRPEDTDPNTQSPATQRDLQRLDQYATMKSLGEGSFGKVKLAVHRASGRQVALKVIPRRKLLSRDMVGRVEREIQYLQLLRHPHIIKLYTVITTKADIVMVLEYAERELFDYLVERGKCNDDEARTFFQQIICAVEYCHRHKIVHRDLKPENLLIDSEKSVKIADFGLSNIMTDGNFLKTSCGSPNYAAPEVISGKLYAGPEVDVWSCGVILYVLLVGKLPFDDDYIPALFKKISAGNFHMPSYISSGAANLIKRMLQVHPVHRITIPEIRKDPWFLKNIPSYLQLPDEEFVVAGVDPHKAIDPRKIAPGRSPTMQDRIYKNAVTKLEWRMGYGREDIQDALKNPEPSAIKDAFFIVVENEMMQTNSPPDTDQTDGAFTKKSAPTDIQRPRGRSGTDSGDTSHESVKPLTPVNREPAVSSPPIRPTEPDIQPRVSHVRILPTSLPYVHDQVMTRRDKERAARASQPSADDASQQTSEGDAEEKPADDGVATTQALKPHARSIVDLETLNLEPPESLARATSQPKKSRKWQFGIRSRNQPYEAMLCLYKALKAQGGVWDIQPAEPDSNENEPSEESKTTSDIPEALQRKYSHLPPDHYVPKELWFIRARLLKQGVHSPGPTSSTHSSRSDLEEYRRRVSLMGGVINPEDKSVAGFAASAAAAAAAGASSTGGGSVGGGGGTAASSLSSHPAMATYGVWVFVDIQLYQLEAGTFMVDFKCDGYQNVIKVDVDGGTAEWRPISKRIRNKEKEVTSPYPFLDVASDLVAQLAVAG